MKRLCMVAAVLSTLGCVPTTGPDVEEELQCEEVGTESGTESGYELCDGSALERRTPVACGSNAADYDYACSSTREGAACATDADCGEAGLQTCVQYYEGCYCGRSSCAEDSDCGDGFACVCHDVLDDSLDGFVGYERLTGRNACIPAACRSDADCADDESCRLSRGGTNCCDAADYGGLFCTTPDDECQSDADCMDGDGCVYDESRSRWSCQAWLCVCD